ncbi:MAG: hypothetical protein ACRDY7_10755 [Acidimicrobiia bacterium]
MGTSRTPDQQAGRLASRQHGAITHAQLLAAGLTDRQIKQWSRCGRLHRAARNTYVMAGAPPTAGQAALVACLAGPGGTVASHLTAAALFGLWPPPLLPHVTAPRGTSARLRVALVHRSTLCRDDVASIAGIPLTRPARILVDCAGMLGHEALCELVDDVLCRRLCTAEDVRRAMGRASRGPGRAGLPSLEQALAVWVPGPPPGSRAEMRLVRRLVAWGYPTPERQVPIYDGAGVFLARVDVGWAPTRVGLEYYGQRHHGPRHEEHDAGRKARAEGQGWQIRVVRKADLSGNGARALRRWLTDRLGLARAA